MTLLALWELVRVRSRFQAQWIAVDEVFDALDTAGKEAVRDILTTLRQHVTHMFVIAHSDLPQGLELAGVFHFSMKRSSSGSPKGVTVDIQSY